MCPSAASLPTAVTQSAGGPVSIQQLQLLLARTAAAATRDPDVDGAGPLEPRQHPGPADQPGLCRLGLRQPLAPPRHAGAALGDGAAQALGDEPGGRAPRGM